MKYYRITSDTKWQLSHDCWVYAEHSPKLERVMPPMACPVCGHNTRDTRNPGFCYPAVDVTRFPSALRKQLDYGTVVDPEGWETLRQRVQAFLPYEVPITPGTLFGPGTLRVSGGFPDVYPKMQFPGGRFMLSNSAVLRLRDSGIQDLFAVPILLQSLRKAPDQYLELQIEHQARLSGSLDRTDIEAKLRKVKAEWARRRVLVCERCGREDGKLPDRIVLVGSTIPERASLFRISQRPLTVLCTEVFAQAVRKLALTNILFERVYTDGSETTKGLSKVHICRPDLWSSPRSTQPSRGRIARPMPKAKAAPSGKAPSFPRIDRLLQAPALLRNTEAVRALARTCFRLTFHPTRRNPIGASRFGGLPDLPKTMAWPGEPHAQLDFVVQLNCADLNRALPGNGLPVSGWLWFFYDVEHSPEGLSREQKKLWAVRYYDGPVETLSRSSAPAWWVESTAFPTCRLSIQSGEWLPDAGDSSIGALNLKPAETRAYAGVIKKLRGPGKVPLHKVLGWPDTIQNAMEANCQRMAGKGDWRLLLQLDSDATINTMWGDSGRIYVWIRQEDLRAKRFDRCWVLAQSF